MCKSVNDISKLSQLFEGEDFPIRPAEAPEYKTSAKTEIVTTMAYMLGVRDEYFERTFAAENPEIAKALRKNEKATVIRDICILRSQLLNNYSDTGSLIRYDMKNIDRIDWFDQSAIKRLAKAGISAVQANYLPDDYSVYFTKLIADHISDCKNLFPEWLKFDYIKELFYNPGYKKDGVLKKEFKQFHENKLKYPYGMYINWKPEDVGNLLIADNKFVNTVYAQHGEKFTDASKLHDAVDYTKQSIYDFIGKSDRTAIIVDCENSDVFKLYGVLKNLKPEEVGKIEKIILYDDYHTTNAWTWLKHFINIPVEYVDVERVCEYKSLVDIKMTAGACTAFYEDHIESFILCSSDSDFWGLISSLPKANFLVMYEYSKCGQAIKDALDSHQIFHCSMDDFFTGNAGDFQKAVLLRELKRRADSVIGRSAMEVTREIYAVTKIHAKESEMERFCDKYVKSIRLKLDKDGIFMVEVMAG